jgi:hypothetical protein
VCLQGCHGLPPPVPGRIATQAPQHRAEDSGWSSIFHLHGLGVRGAAGARRVAPEARPLTAHRRAGGGCHGREPQRSKSGQASTPEVADVGPARPNDDCRSSAAPLDWPVPSCWDHVKALVQGEGEEELGPAEGADQHRGGSHTHGREITRKMRKTSSSSLEPYLLLELHIQVPVYGFV